MNLTNVTEIRELLGSLTRKPSSKDKSSYFNKITFNKFFIELYAGPKSLSEPPVEFDQILYYDKIQVAIYEFIKEEECAILPGTDTRFAGFDWNKYFTYTDGKGKLKPSYMGAGVPITEVISLIRDVYKVSRLKIFF